MAAGAVTTTKSIRRRRSSSRTIIDGLTEPNVIRDQEIHAGKAQRLAQWKKLVGVKPDAGAEGCLQEVSIARGCRVPTDSANVGRQHFGGVGGATTNLPPAIVNETLRADLGVPKDVQPLALCVIGNAG
jgi:hypothetical protein